MVRLRYPVILLTLLAAGPAPPAAQNPSFNLANRGAIAIRELFVTPGGNANWGQNRLDGKNGNATAIAPGATYLVRRRTDTNCVFDIKVVFADGRAEERKGVNTCATEEVAIGAAMSTAINPATGKSGDDPSIKLFNRAARPVIEFSAVPAGGGGSASNRLGDKLPPDTTRNIALPRDGNCIFDLRAVFEGGRSVERKHVNLCRVAEMAVP